MIDFIIEWLGAWRKWLPVLALAVAMWATFQAGLWFQANREPKEGVTESERLHRACFRHMARLVEIGHAQPSDLRLCNDSVTAAIAAVRTSSLSK